MKTKSAVTFVLVALFVVSSVAVLAPIPEYPLGLPLLAIFMIISYGLIRIRTSAKEL